MMNDLNRFIFQRNIMQRYASEFQQYMIKIFYGNIVLGSDIVGDYTDDEE